MGGTKLGTGGLVRAYGEAASNALDLAKVEEIIPRHLVEVVFSYDDTSGAMHAIHQFDIVIQETRYSDVTLLILAVRTAQSVAFEAAFIEACSGRGWVRTLD